MARVERASIEDLQRVVCELHEFWDERDMGFLHQALYFHEFGDTALVIRDESGVVLAYLLGFLGPRHVGYIHAVAVRAGARGCGLARRLYAEFERIVAARGALALKAITDPANSASIAFHRSLGFAVEEVQNYSLTRDTRTVFRRSLVT
jgi:predicted GNAT superfamily acetyltransferase